MRINEVLGQLRSPNWLKVKGPWLTGQRVVPQFEQTMLTYSCKVTRGTYFDTSDMPFGYFVTVNPVNAAECQLEILEVPPTGETHVFAIRTSRINKVNELICKATITKQIVPVATEAATGSMIWESKVTPIDSVHAEIETMTITEVAVLDSSAWDEALNVWVNSVSELTQSTADPTVTVVGTNVVHTFYREVKCGWYLKIIETFAKINRTYKTNIEFYWPAVLHQTTPLETKAYDRKDLPNGDPGGSNNYVDVIFIKEAYRGPCKASVTEVWNLAAVDPLPEPQVMLPLPLTYQSPFSSFNVGPTLHALIEYDSVIADDPEFVDVTINYTYGATSPTDWPASIIASDSQDPVRGGYLRRTITVYPPTYTP